MFRLNFRLLTIFLLFFAAWSVFAQSIIFENNKTFKKLEIFPANPTDADTIKLVVYMENRRPNSGYVSSEWELLASEIKITAQYFRAYRYRYPTFRKKETLTTGRLPAGTYTVGLIRANTTLLTTVEPPHDHETRFANPDTVWFTVTPTRQRK